MKNFNKFLSLLFVLWFLFVWTTFASQERITTASHDVIKVTLDGKHKFVVNAVQNWQEPKAVKTLMDEVWWVSAINGAFFDAYSAVKSTDMLAITDWVKRSTYWDDLWETRALFGFQYDWTPIMATNETRSWSNVTNNWENSEFSKFQYWLSMQALIVNWTDVSYKNSEMNNDKKQWAASTKEFICSTKDKKTVYFWRVYNVTFMWLSEYVRNTFWCYDAIQLDAWWSMAIYYNWEKIAWPWRNVMDAFVVVENKSNETTVTNESTEELSYEDEVAKAKRELWSKAAIFESLVPLFKAKDQKTQENVKALLKTFKKSRDAYTRNIWIYFGYLVE